MWVMVVQVRDDTEAAAGAQLVERAHPHHDGGPAGPAARTGAGLWQPGASHHGWRQLGAEPQQEPARAGQAPGPAAALLYATHAAQGPAESGSRWCYSTAHALCRGPALSLPTQGAAQTPAETQEEWASVRGRGRGRDGSLRATVPSSGTLINRCAFHSLTEEFSATVVWNLN